MKRFITFIITILHTLFISYSQPNYRFENIAVQQGFYYNHVYDIVQDKYGFIWIADSSGLNRYDGYSFTNFSYKAGNDKTIKESAVKFILLDQDKNLWFYGKRQNFYDYKTEKFIQFKIPTPHPKGEIPDSFVLMDFKTQKFYNAKIPDAVGGKNLKNNISISGTFSKNILWLKADRKDTVFIYSILSDDSGSVKRRNPILAISGPGIEQIYADPEGTLWIIQNGMLKYYDNETKIIVTYVSLPSKDKYVISCMRRDSRNRLWLGCNNFKGLICIDLKTKNIFTIKADMPGKDKLYANNITTIFEDSFGLLWIGTENNSIYTTNLNIKKFELLTYANGLAENNTQGVFEDSRGTRYFASRKGLAVMQPDGKVHVYKTNEAKLPHIFIGNHILTFYELPGNNIVTAGIGLSVVNFSKNDYNYLMPDNTDSSLSSWAMYNIHKGQKSGHYWITGQHGFNEIDDFNLAKALPGTTKRMCPKIKLFSEKTIGVQFNVIWSAFEDKTGIVWLCTGNGVLRYDPLTNTYKHFPPNVNNPNALQSNDVNCCYEDHKGRLWFATQDGGLSRLDRKTGKFYTITKEDGLPGNNLFGILEDSKGNLWISSNSGLCRYNPDTKQARCFYESDGIQGNVFNQFAFYKAQSGKMYFGGTNGVTAFNPDSIIESTITPRVVVTKFYINNKPVEVGEKVNGEVILKESLMKSMILDSLQHDALSLQIGDHHYVFAFKTPKIKLSHRNNAFAIEFTGLHFLAPDKIRYKYKLEGFEKDWIFTDSQQRRAHYSNLPGGTYLFKVQACNSDGVWNKEDCSVLIIKVSPPFYRTWWFILLSIIAIIWIGRYYIRYRERKLKQDKEVLEQKVEERTGQLREANEELSSQAEILEDQKEELAEKNKDITDSIHYAKRIQNALLPQGVMNERKDILIYFRPKDIVSGDFYWLASAAGKEFIAAVDCTGHGVPGAFMSIIGTSILNKIIKEYKIYKPSEMLFMLNSELRNTLKSYSADDEVKDGMDLSLIAVDPNLNKVEYVGAMNSIYLVRNGQLNEFKADRNSIGKNTDSNFNFTNHEIETQTGDTIYLFSDGFEDQFGGPDGKKYKASRMKDLLTSISSLEMQEQYNKLNTAFEEWQGSLEQIDDVLVMGRKV
jgi:ligand-binding sensor domain-containing protein/serine phosphatase RsbU (regulator of sigma subunit)